MSKTVLITGTSSGIGQAAVQYFSENGWNVAATMRSPEKDETLKNLKNVKVYKLDVTDEVSIQNAINQTISDFGAIDVVVNNAGYGAVGIFEKATNAQIQKQFDTNVFGVMNVVRQILPYFRKQKNGTIINVTSIGGLVTFPIYSVYHGTKWAVEGWSEALSHELRPLGIKVKNVEPGAIKTEFYEGSMDLFKNDSIKDYDNYEKVTYANTQQAGADAPGPIVVAKVIFKAANDDNFRLRYAVGAETKFFLFLRRILPNNWFFGAVRMIVEKGFKK